MGSPIKNKLNDKEVFDLYFNNPDAEAGTMSFPKIYRKLLKESKVKFTPSAVWQAAYRYFVRNYHNPKVETAYAMWYINSGLSPLSHKDYLHEVSKRARTVFSKNQYRNWCDKHSDIEYLEK